MGGGIIPSLNVRVRKWREKADSASVLSNLRFATSHLQVAGAQMDVWKCNTGRCEGGGAGGRGRHLPLRNVEPVLIGGAFE